MCEHAVVGQLVPRDLVTPDPVTPGPPLAVRVLELHSVRQKTYRSCYQAAAAAL